MIARGVWQLEQFGRFVDFVARTLAVLPRAMIERFGEVVWQFEQVAVKSLPIVFGAGIKLGSRMKRSRRRLRRDQVTLGLPPSRK